MGRATLQSRLFNWVPDQYVELRNAELVRKLRYGNDWQRIRIGCLIAYNGYDVIQSKWISSPLGQQCYFGLCFGTDRPASAYRADNFVGLSLTGNYLATNGGWNYAAGSGNPYYGAAAVGQIFRRVGNTSTPTATAIAAVNIAAAALGTLKRRTPLFIDFLKAAGGITITVYGCSTTTVLVDYRPDHLLSGVDQLGTPVINGQTMTVLLAASTALSVSGAMGNPNSLSFYSSSLQFPMEVYALAASIVSTPLVAYEEDYGGALETFEFYGTTGATGSTPASMLSSGSGWTAAPTLTGYSNPNMSIGLYGSSAGFPDDPFAQYSTGTVYSGTTLSAGSGWSNSAVFGGYPNPGPTGRFVTLWGTTGWPDEPFAEYTAGTITSGVTVSSGTGWIGPAIIV